MTFGKLRIAWSMAATTFLPPHSTNRHNARCRGAGAGCVAALGLLTYTELHR
jgi:hypothetical protein